MRPIDLQLQATGQEEKKLDSTSSLEEIEGIGQTKRRNLLVYFGGIQGIKEADVRELLLVEGINVKLAEKYLQSFSLKGRFIENN